WYRHPRGTSGHGACTFQHVGETVRTRRPEEVPMAWKPAIVVSLALLASVAGAQNADDLALGPARGPAGATLTIVEFCDFQCGYCAGLDRTLKALQRRYADVRVVYRHFPRASHGNAPKAAEAAACAGDQDRFWEMHDLLYAHQD